MTQINADFFMTFDLLKKKNWGSMDALIRKDVPNRERLFDIKEDDNPIILYFELDKYHQNDLLQG
jgi:hypothetical protein